MVLGVFLFCFLSIVVDVGFCCADKNTERLTYCVRILLVGVTAFRNI